MFVKPAFFAEMCNVSRTAISKKIKNKTLVIDSGGMIDTDNPVNHSYFEFHQKKNLNDKLKNKPEENVEFAEKKTTANEMLNMTIGELIERFGSDLNVEKYVKMQKDLVVTDEKEQKIEERRLIQIPKDFVSSVVFGLLEVLMQRLLDIPDRIADQVIAYVQADAKGSRAKIIKDLSENITAAIIDTKVQIKNKIENMKNKYDKEDLLQDAVSEILNTKME